MHNEPKTISETPQTDPNVPLSTIDIEIGGEGSKSYKSIDNILWKDVPPFAVLTGENGSGKTQLLEALAYGLMNVQPPTFHYSDQLHIKVARDEFDPGSVVFIPNQLILGGSGIDIRQMSDRRGRLLEEISESNAKSTMHIRRLKTRLQAQLGVDPNTLSKQEFIERLPDNWEFMLDESNIIDGLTHVFYSYNLRTLENLQLRKTELEIRNLLGTPPWEVLNEVLKTAGFRYQVLSPVGTRLDGDYIFQLEDQDTKLQLPPHDLSSGEKMIFALVYWLYSAQHHGRFPRLFLLDEPDAHLHPSMTRQFMNVIQEVLVNKYHVRVIMTTHSPSTVALAPEESLFIMSKNQPRIYPAQSRSATIGLLTAGFVTVSPTTRYVLAEDDDDVKFYEAIRDILTDYGPGKDPRAIKPEPTIVFLPASRGTGSEKEGGGKLVVEGWVSKLDQPPFNELIRGVIDKDRGNTATSRVLVLGRYSIENYYLDPFVIYGRLLLQGMAPKIEGVDISAGTEHSIKDLEQGNLQAIVNYIQSKVEPELSQPDTSRQIVVFTNSKRVEYPAWMLNYRGKDLMLIYQKLFSKDINQKRLRESLLTTRFVPLELAEIFHNLQN